MDLQGHRSFLLAQKFTLLVNRFDFFLYDNQVQGAHIAFVEQKRFAFREEMTVWRDESRSETLFSIKAEKILDIHGKFLVRDTAGIVVGYCRKAFGSSLLRSTWEIYNAQDELQFVAKEANLFVALARRILQFVPIVADISQVIPFNFVFEKDGRSVGSHRRIWGSLTDRYAITVDELLDSCDRRIILALCILLDTLQER